MDSFYKLKRVHEDNNFYQKQVKCIEVNPILSGVIGYKQAFFYAFMISQYKENLENHTLNDEKEFTMSQKQLMDNTGLGRVAVESSIKDLCGLKLITCEVKVPVNSKVPCYHFSVNTDFTVLDNLICDAVTKMTGFTAVRKNSLGE